MWNVDRHVTQLSTNQIASATSKDVNKLKALTRKLGKQQQLQVEKLEGDFRDAVGRYSDLQKVGVSFFVIVWKLTQHVLYFYRGLSVCLLFISLLCIIIW